MAKFRRRRGAAAPAATGPADAGRWSQRDYHHPAAGWGAAKSVGEVVVRSRELLALRPERYRR